MYKINFLVRIVINAFTFNSKATRALTCVEHILQGVSLKWRETKQHPCRATTGHQISCGLVSLHFLCYILSSHPVFPYLMRGNVDVSKKYSLVLLLHRVYGHLGGKRRAVRPPGSERIARRLYGCENQPADAARKISLQRISVNIPPKDVTSTDKQHGMKCAC